MKEVNNKNIVLPDREPDLILPETENKYEVHIWVAESLYRIMKEDAIVVTDTVRGFYDSEAIKFLNEIINNENECQPRREVASTYILERNIFNSTTDSTEN